MSYLRYRSSSRYRTTVVIAWVRKILNGRYRCCVGYCFGISCCTQEARSLGSGAAASVEDNTWLPLAAVILVGGNDRRPHVMWLALITLYGRAACGAKTMQCDPSTIQSRGMESSAKRLI